MENVIKEKSIKIELTAKYRTALMDGSLVPDSDYHMATEDFYHAFEGDRLSLVRDEYLYSVAIFNLERDDHFIYEYDYQKEENWTTYTQNVTPDSYIDNEYKFEEECYFRVNVRRKDGLEIADDDIAICDEIVVFESDGKGLASKKDTLYQIFENEINDTIEKVKIFDGKDILKLTLLSDSHNVINGTWNTTIFNMGKVVSKTGADGIIHLGDLTDGMVSKELTKKKVNSMISDMQSICDKTYIALGNHDHNYFKNKKREYNNDEINEVYGFQDGPNYTVDYEEKNLTIVFLDSFDDNETIRYGYDESTLAFMEKVISDSKPGRRLLIISHCPPLEELDYWSFHIRNGRRLVKILDDANISGRCEVIGMLYGHTHSDYVFEGCSFPMVSISCNKLEYFLDKKPKNANVFERNAGDISEDLWDILAIDFEEKKLNFIRFGAGKDRCVSYLLKNKSYEDTLKDRRNNRSTKIWAHRGASGYAPENTLEAFMIAINMGADGIETDVQLTKDGVPVIIHDERIDRVSDGTGFVKDYTLSELKKFNFNNKMNRFGFVTIPTLEDFFKMIVANPYVGEGFAINLELKNGIIDYDGLEAKVMELVRQYHLEDQVIYSSFNHDSMLRVKALDKNAKIGFLYSNVITGPNVYALSNGADAMHPSVGVVKIQNTVEMCHEYGVKVHVWTVNEADDIKSLMDLRVDAIITNYIDRCL